MHRCRGLEQLEVIAFERKEVIARLVEFRPESGESVQSDVV